MIYRTVNLSPNYDKWDGYTRTRLLNEWRIHYYENNINMSPIDNMYQGGQGYFDSQIYYSSLDSNNLKDLSPTDENHPVNIAFQKRQKELEIEFNNSVQADKERLINLIEVEKDAHDYWQKNELLLKVLGEDENGNLYPKELVDEIRFEAKLSEENFRCSMEDLINYDVAYNHPLSYPNRDLNKFPVADKERQEWCNRESFEGIKREYKDVNGINQENRILDDKSLMDENSYRGVFPAYINDDRIPKGAKDFYNNYTPSFSHNEQRSVVNDLTSNQKQNRVEGQKVNKLEEKIRNYNYPTENENIISNIQQVNSIEIRDERISSAKEKIKDVIPKQKEFKPMQEMSSEKSFFSSWIEITREKVSDFKEKAISLWEDRVAPKLGIETEKSRKEAYQEVINKINLQEIRNFEKGIAQKQKPKGESQMEIHEKNSLNEQNLKESQAKKRRPSSGIKDNNSDDKLENEIKNKPTGESSKQESVELKTNENKFSRKIQ